MSIHVSETRALQRLRDVLREIETQVNVVVHNQARRFALHDLINEADRLAATLESQAHRGIHTNPPLVIYGNPPMMPLRRPGLPKGTQSYRYYGQMSRNVHDVRYTHIVDGKDYKHPFGGDVEMYAIIADGKYKDVLLTGGSGQPLWKDFE